MKNPKTLNIIIVVLFLCFGLNGFSQLNDTDKSKINNSAKDSIRQIYMKDVVAAADKYFEENPGGRKQFKRMEQYMLNRLGSDGRIVNSTARNYKAYQLYMQQQADNRSMTWAHNGSWEFIGPNSTDPQAGPSGAGQGRVNRFAFHPTDPNTVFAATAGGGLWKTTDKGMSWDPLSDGVPVMNTTGVAVDYVNPDIIYLLSGDGDGVGSFYYFNWFTRTSIGVFKSTDGGNLWKPTGLFFDETDAVLAYNLYMSPEDRLTLYACTSEGLYRTQNGGDDWEKVRDGLIYELEFKPGTADRIYCINKTHFFVSDDGGDTWIDSTLIPPVDGRSDRMSMTTCDGNPELVYLIASPVDTLTANDTLPDMRGLYLSANSGLDFAQIATRPNLLAGGSGEEFKSQAWYDIALECNPLDPTELLIGSIGIWKSTDAGGAWDHISGINSAYHADIHTIHVNPLDNTTYIGNDGGVYISNDFGDTYEFRSDFLAITQYYDIATSPFFTYYTLAGAQDNGVHLRNDIETLLDRVAWGDGMKSLFHPTVDSLVLTSVHQGEIFISSDTGHTFSQIIPPPDGGDTAEWTTPLAFHANDPDMIFIGFKPIMKSTDGGETFSPTSNDTISGHRILENNISNPDRIYAGDCRKCNDNVWFEMYVSSNAGNTWTRIDTNPGFPSPGYFISDATINPDNSQEIWITVGRYVQDYKVFRSTDGGSTWNNMSGTLPNVPVNAIIFEDNNGSPAYGVYIATDIGVFYRNSDLGDWIYFNNNMPSVEVTDLDIDYNGGLLRASTYGRGMWESELYTGCQPIISLNTSNQAIGASYVHQATDHIFSTAHVDGYGSRVLYKCENEVNLTEGFHATSKKGAVFKALLSLCDDGGIEETADGGSNAIEKR